MHTDERSCRRAALLGATFATIPAGTCLPPPVPSKARVPTGALTPNATGRDTPRRSLTVVMPRSNAGASAIASEKRSGLRGDQGGGGWAPTRRMRRPRAGPGRAGALPSTLPPLCQVVPRAPHPAPPAAPVAVLPTPSPRGAAPRQTPSPPLPPPMQASPTRGTMCPRSPPASSMPARVARWCRPSTCKAWPSATASRTQPSSTARTQNMR